MLANHRRISRDPLDNAEMRLGPNLYQYVSNNPISLIDPLGLDQYGYVWFGHLTTVITNPNNPTGSGLSSFDFGPASASPLKGWPVSTPGIWLEGDGPPPGSFPLWVNVTTPAQDQQMIDAFRDKVRNQGDTYAAGWNNCWQAPGKVINPILFPPVSIPQGPLLLSGGNTLVY